MATYLDFKLFQMDVKTDFLNGSLEKEIYMDQPIGFVLKGQEDKVCHLKRSIYDLKYSSKSWYLRFHEIMTSFGLFIISEDHCVYVKRSAGEIMFLTLYADDILSVSYTHLTLPTKRIV